MKGTQGAGGTKLSPGTTIWAFGPLPKTGRYLDLLLPLGDLPRLPGGSLWASCDGKDT